MNSCVCSGRRASSGSCCLRGSDDRERDLGSGRKLSPGDTIIDGGNTFYRDDIRRAKLLKERSVEYVDVGTSGGVWGLERGFCMMVGGHKATIDAIDPILRDISARHGRH